ncbi:Lipoprotein OS=Streptomyces microflavus OX=1919 GN=G3I39_08440 PE=4 SV=1 [Streptomyces microflavus]
MVGAEYVLKLTPRHWGGWGYRCRPEQGTAVVVRKAAAMALLLGDGRTFGVTVHDAESAVRFIRERMHLAAAAERARGRG